MQKLLFPALLLLATLTVDPAHAGDTHRLGLGATYWTAVDDVDVDKIDDDGFSFMASYQYWPTLLGVELDLEILPDKYGENSFSPQAYVLFGKAIYAGAGIGIDYRDGGFAEEPFFALRAGLNLEILPTIYWDIYGTYRFNDSADLDDEKKDIDSDTVYLGTALRFAF